MLRKRNHTIFYLHRNDDTLVAVNNNLICMEKKKKIVAIPTQGWAHDHTLKMMMTPGMLTLDVKFKLQI